MTRIRDKPPTSPYPITDRIIWVAAGGILLACLLGCLGPGQGREAHYITHTVDKPVAATTACQRPVEYCLRGGRMAHERESAQGPQGRRADPAGYGRQAGADT